MVSSWKDSNQTDSKRTDPESSLDRWEGKSTTISVLTHYVTNCKSRVHLSGEESSLIEVQGTQICSRLRRPPGRSSCSTNPPRRRRVICKTAWHWLCGPSANLWRKECDRRWPGEDHFLTFLYIHNPSILPMLPVTEIMSAQLWETDVNVFVWAKLRAHWFV